MSLRLQSGFFSLENIEYDIEIHDLEFSGAATAFVLGGNGFTLDYEGNEQERFNPIVSSKLTLSILIEDATQKAFIEDLVGAAENRFFIKIKKSGILDWVGLAITDTYVREDRDKFFFNLTATDGLAALKTVDYHAGLGIRYFGKETLLGHLFNALNRTGIQDFYNSEKFLITSSNWTEARHSLPSNSNLFPFTQLDHRTFYEVDKKGNTKFKSCYDVIKNICTITGTRIMMSGGCYRINQINYYNQPQFKEVAYDKNQNFLYAQLESHGHLSGSSNNTKLGGGVYRYLPGLKEVVLNYKHRSSENHLSGYEWALNNEVTYDLGEIGFSAGDSLLIKMQIEWDSNFFNSLTIANHMHKWGIMIKQGTEYLHRALTVFSYNIYRAPVSWQPTDSRYEVNSDILEGQYNAGVINVSFKTPILSGSGSIEVLVEYQGTFKPENNQAFTLIDLGVNWNTVNPSLEIVKDNLTAFREDEREYKVTNTEKPNNRVILPIETLIGDGPEASSLGKLETSDGTTFDTSSSWSTQTGNENVEIQNLLIQEILSGRKTPVTLMDSGFKGSFGAHGVILYDSKRWILAQGSYNANRNEWNGIWFEISATTGGINIETPKPQPIGQNIEIIESEISKPTQGTNLGQTILDFIKKGITDSPIQKGTPITSIPITALPSGVNFNSGDTIKLINPVTGNTETLILADNPNNPNDTSRYVEGNTTLFIESFTPSADYEKGAYLIRDANESPIKINSELYKVLDYSGEFIDVPFDLPILETEIDSRLILIREYAHGIYNVTYTIGNDINGDRRRITPNIPFDNEGLLIKLLNN